MKTNVIAPKTCFEVQVTPCYKLWRQKTQTVSSGCQQILKADCSIRLCVTMARSFFGLSLVNGDDNLLLRN